MFNKSISIILLFFISLNCYSRVEQLFDCKFFDSQRVREFRCTTQVEVVQRFYDDHIKPNIVASNDGPYFLIHLLELICVKLNSIADQSSELYECLSKLDQEVSYRLSVIHERCNRNRMSDL